MPMICFSGWKGSGKDECAKYLIEKHNAVRVAFADPLKDNAAKQFYIDRSSLDDPKRKELPLLNLPVDPKDGFTRMITEFMKGEFRDQNGKPYGEGSPESIIYWTPRAIAILEGSTKRAVNPNYWTDRAFNSITDNLYLGNLVVITDLRYKSEVIQLKEEFGEETVFVRINRRKESPSTDPSERDLDDHQFDYYLDNTGTLKQTFEQLEEILIKYKTYI